MKCKTFFIFIYFLFCCSFSHAYEKVRFIGELPTPGEYSLFAGGGWDGNWFVGSTQKWVSKLPPVDTSGFKRAFLGARLGRAKTLKQVRERLKNKSGENDAQNYALPERPGKIKIGVSESIEEFPKGDLLVYTDEIPLEGSDNHALRGVGESRWFFREIDINEISDDKNNFVFLFSNDQFLNSASVSPILAAGISSTGGNDSYIIKDGKEKSAINYFEPAVAIKLVAEDSPVPGIKVMGFKEHPHLESAHAVITDVRGEYISKVWLEVDNGSGWQKKGVPEYSPPFDLLFDYEGFEKGEYRIRAGVLNWWEKKDYSQPVVLSID
ncbi:MAG: hypothetical protein ACQESB_05110 [Elusimicrobiota bacterium]